jgi:DNA gyrase subunit B
MYNEALSGFANGIRTSDGGSHLDGMKAAITRTINTCAKKVQILRRQNNMLTEMKKNSWER